MTEKQGAPEKREVRSLEIIKSQILYCKVFGKSEKWVAEMHNTLTMVDNTGAGPIRNGAIQHLDNEITKAHRELNINSH